MIVTDELEFEISVATSDGREAGNAALEQLGRSLGSLPGVRELSVQHALLVVRGKRDVRADAARVIFEQGMLPIHLRQRVLSLDDIYDRYFQEGGGAGRGSE